MRTKQFVPDRDIPDLTGKVVVVTGGSAGLGEETILRLAAHNPKCIYLCARTISKAEKVISKILEQYANANIKPVHLDLSSLKSVKSAAENIIESTSRLDLLFLNAGVSGTAPALTEEGYEWQFGVNYLAHVLFAHILTPLLLHTAQASPDNDDVRVITVASEAAKMFGPKKGILFSDLKSDMSSYGPFTRYGQSKLANILFARKFAQLYPSVKSISVHPGLVKTENYSKGDGAGWLALLWKSMLLFTGLSVEEGAKVQLWAAVGTDVTNGKFYNHIGEEDDGGRWGRDQGLVDELWAWTANELAE